MRTMLAILMLAALVGAAAPAGAQGGGAPATVPAADAGAAPDATTSVDDILAGEEDVLAGTTYSYDPGSRRDPFRSLLAAKNKAEQKRPGVDWVRPSELLASRSARVAGRGIDFQLNSAGV